MFNFAKLCALFRFVLRMPKMRSGVFDYLLPMAPPPLTPPCLLVLDSPRLTPWFLLETTKPPLTDYIFFSELPLAALAPLLPLITRALAGYTSSDSSY